MTTDSSRISPAALIINFSVLAIVAGALFFLSSTGCSKTERVQRSNILMDTLVTVTAYGTREQCDRAINLVFDELSRFEKAVSYHLPESELSKLNRERSISLPGEEFRSVFLATEEAVRKTEGYFDPTVAPLKEAYGLYNPVESIPDDEEVAGIMSSVGWKQNVSSDGQSISLAASAKIGFGGIAGGVALSGLGQREEITDCLGVFIDRGGDLFFTGAKPDGMPWKIAVKDPRGESFLAFIETRQTAAISTSGNYERFVEIDGKTVGHIFDPFTGRPSDYYLSVTVVASTTIEADVYSTGIFAMPPEMAKEWTERHKVPALILFTDNQVWVSPAGKTWFIMPEIGGVRR